MKKTYNYAILLKKTGYLILSVNLFSAASQAQTIAQQPIYLQNSDAVEPNIMLTLDDSGSMTYPYLSDNNTQPSGWRLYNSSNNKLYYNPTVRYRPWINSNGTEKSSGTTKCTKTTSGSLWNQTVSYNCYYAKNDGTYVYIYSGVNSYVGGPNRTDCTDPNACTFAEEQQNFANWNEYYNTRLKAAKAGIGRAFYALNNKVRVGYGRINKSSSVVDGSNTATIVSGVRKFTTEQKDLFFTWLYNMNATGVTPLRRALDDVGLYFEREKNGGSPWADNPGEASFGGFKTCRQSFHILMTDGYWNSTGATNARGNIDNQDGEKNTNHNGGGDIQYIAKRPFSDSSSNTLADVANYYWKRDLQPDINNKVNVSTNDPAYWQHLANYTISFGLPGNLTYSAATLAQITAGTLSWPTLNDSNVNSEIPAKIDDLWHAAVNSYGGFYSAANPEEFVAALTDTFIQIQARVGSSSSVASNSTKLSSDTTIYQAKFNTASWSGELSAYKIDESNKDVGDSLWNASEVLPSPAKRKIYTLSNNGNSGTEFKWSSLSNTQKNILNSTDNQGEARTNWIRGDQSNETANGGLFRARSSLLGDMINSSPVLVGNQYYGYGDAAFTAAKANRRAMVYIGANDGMLHAFDAATGEEKFAYIPQGIFSALPELMKTDYPSNHRYYVDGSPKIGDAQINNQWKTVLIGSTGAGGKSVFALDVTDPSSFGSSTVMWEYTSTHMGHAIAQPTLTQLQGTDDWAAIIPNGYNSSDYQAKLVLLDLANGNELKVISTNEGSVTYPNGLSSAIPVDINNDHKTDYIYAGDLRGNLWRFDVTSSNSTNWIPTKIFTACSTETCTDSNRQPITIRPEVVAHKNGGVLVLFGTGSDFATEDRTSTQLQTMYAVWDKLQSNPAGLNRTHLVAQTITAEPTVNNIKYRIVSKNEVDYSNKYGFHMNLVPPGATDGNGERIINNLIVDSDKVIFTTMIPSTDPCDYGGKSWLMELSLMTGKHLTYSVFDVNGDNVIDDNDFNNEVPLSGRGFDDIANTPAIVKDGTTASDGGTETKYINSSSGTIYKVRETSPQTSGGRQSWRQLR